MTEDNMALLEFAEKHQDGELFRELGQWTLQRLMELEAQQQCGAERHERSSGRVNRRNGYRDRSLQTRLGAMELRIPKLRSGSYYPAFLEPRKAAEQALVAVVQEAYVKGVSTRNVDSLVQAMGMSGMSRSQVSRLCADLDGKVKKFLSRPLKGNWVYLWLDATYLKSREDGQVESTAVVVAVGVNTEGRREVLGLACGPAETEAFWTAFLRDLLKRGLRGVVLVISDAHQGLKTAIEKVLKVTWQRCRVHFMRNALALVPQRHHPMVAALIRTAFVQENLQEAHRQWRQNAETLGRRFPKLAQLMDEAEEDVLAFMAYPREHWPQLASTNTLERVMKEIKRRANVVGIFPNDASILRLVGTLLMEQTDEWQVTRRYMSNDSITKVMGREDSAGLIEGTDVA